MPTLQESVHALFGKGVLVEQAHELHSHRADVGAGHGDLAEQPRVAAARQDLRLEAVVGVDLADRRNHVVRCVLGLIQRAVEDGGDIGAGLGGQVRLRQRGDRRDRQPQVGQFSLKSAGAPAGRRHWLAA